MRNSRKAGLISHGVLWKKYACKRVVDVGYYPKETDWKEIGSGGVRDGQSMTGYTNYGMNVVNGRYSYCVYGQERTITAPATGTLYRASGSTITKETWVNNSGVEGTQWQRTVSTTTIYSYSYDIGDEIGSVLVAKDEYPDEQKGYVYAAEQQGYIIMGDEDDTFYAYKKMNEE